MLALAWLPQAQIDDATFNPQGLSRQLVLLGLVGIIDPPREEAIAAVKECHEGGIRVTMITGDHAVTGASIAKLLGIGDGKAYVTGAEVEKMDDDQLEAKCRRIDVFARTSPEHKLRLVRAMQASNQVVAMTGDGVNDAPALKQADVGVAMGIKGTEALPLSIWGWLLLGGFVFFTLVELEKILIRWAFPKVTEPKTA